MAEVAPRRIAPPNDRRPTEVHFSHGSGAAADLPPEPRREEPKRKEYEVTEHTTAPPTRSGLLVAVEELTAVHDRYDSLRSDNAGSSGDSPWPGGDGNLHDSE
jgi:hypothetical protein